MIETVYVFQERSNPSHIQALVAYFGSHKGSLRLCQFAILRPLASQFKRLEIFSFFAVLAGIASLIGNYFYLFCSKEKKVILAMAPYDIRLIFFFPLARRHFMYLHTSWPYWQDQKMAPKTFLSLFMRPLWRKIISTCFDGIFTVSYEAADGIRRHLVSDIEIKTVFHSIPDDFYLEATDIKRKPGGKNVLYVGRMEREKGVGLIVDAAKRNPDVTFNLVGSGALGKYLSGLKLDNLNYYGHVDDRNELKKIIDANDLILQLSYSPNVWVEAFGLAVVEGMARGLIPVTSENPGSRAILGNELGHLAIGLSDFDTKLREIFANSDEILKLREKCLLRAQEFNCASGFSRFNCLLRLKATNE